MDCLVAAGRPAGALLETHRVIGTADANDAALHLLEVAAQAEIRVTHRQHLRVHGTVRVVTSRATLAQCFMLEHERTALRRMALEAVFVLREQGCAAAFVRDAFVRRVTLGATHLPFRHGVMAGEIELTTHVAMTLKTDVLDRALARHGQLTRETAALRPTGREAERHLALAA